MVAMIDDLDKQGMERRERGEYGEEQQFRSAGSSRSPRCRGVAGPSNAGSSGAVCRGDLSGQTRQDRPFSISSAVPVATALTCCCPPISGAPGPMWRLRTRGRLRADAEPQQRAGGFLARSLARPRISRLGQSYGSGSSVTQAKPNARPWRSSHPEGRFFGQGSL
jgi:hypothetical protein